MARNRSRCARSRCARPRHAWILAAVAAAILVVGCKSNLQDRLAGGKAEMEKSADEALAELLAERAKNIREAFEGRESLEGEGHWHQRWAKTVANDGLAARADALAKTHERSKLAQEFKDAAQYLTQQKDYWAESRGELNHYMGLLDQYIGRAKGKNWPFVEHARFEKMFLHANHFERAKSFPEDTQLTSYYRFWKFAFDFPPEKREPFVTYVNRLCRNRLWDYCKSLMWEHRPYAMKKPYLDKLIADLDAFRADYPDSAFKDVTKKLVEDYQADLADLPSFDEYPVLPDGRTNRDAVGGDELVVGPEGITWNGADLAVVKGGDLALDKKARDAAGAALNEKLKKIIDDLSAQFDEPTIELAISQFDRSAPLATLAPLLWAMLDNKITELGLMARRRADGTNRKVGTYLATYYTPWPPNPDVEDRKSPEQKKSDEEERLRHDPRRHVPETIAGMKCRALGRTGKLMAEPHLPTAYLAFGPKQAAAGAIVAPEDLAKETTKAAGPSEQRDAKEMMADGAALDAWVGGVGQAAILAFHTSWTYDDLVRVLQRTLVACTTDVCEHPTEREIQLTIAICE